MFDTRNYWNQLVFVFCGLWLGLMCPHRFVPVLAAFKLICSEWVRRPYVKDICLFWLHVQNIRYHQVLLHEASVHQLSPKQLNMCLICCSADANWSHSSDQQTFPVTAASSHLCRRLSEAHITTKTSSSSSSSACLMVSDTQLNIWQEEASLGTKQHELRCIFPSSSGSVNRQHRYLLFR